MKRPYSPRQRKRRFLLYCEGEATEPEYFKGLARSLRSSLIDVEIADQQRKDPKRLVELAKARRESANREAKLANDENLKYNEVWCVFDGDEHARLNQAIDQAVATGISIAVSNPCFEIWILIHFQDQWAYITCDKAYADVKKHLPNYDKHVDFSRIQGKGNEAVSRAKKMESRAVTAGKWFDNPSTSVWRLVVSLCKGANISIGQI
jgi:hypothetical protein